MEGGRVWSSELLCVAEPHVSLFTSCLADEGGTEIGGQLLCLLIKALGQTWLRRCAGWLYCGRGICMLLFPSPLPWAKMAFGFSAGRRLSPDRGSVEKEVWQCRVKISGFLPFAVTRIRFPPLQQHDVLAVGVMEE